MLPSHLPLNTYFGPYYLVRLIAIGGMAEIYLARMKGLAGFERQLALKVLHPEYADDKTFVDMLVNEAKITVGLNHRNIAQTFDLGCIQNRYFLSMEYVDGADFFEILKRLFEKTSNVPVEAALYVMHDALCGLEYAHTRTDEAGHPLRIIHRDMSPQNILLSRQGEVKIVDFGIAKAAHLTNRTKAGVIKGKLVYMSPEQAWGDPVDHRTDIFSLGIVLYEALAGGSLYAEKNPVRLLEMVRKGEVKPLLARRPEVPPDLDALVMKALAPRAADRYASAQQFAAAVADYLRRTAPAFSEQSLGELVESVLSDGKPKRPTKPAANPSDLLMVREDYALQHSIIFSADDMLKDSRSPFESAEGGGTPPVSPSPSRPPAPPAPRQAMILLIEEAAARPFILGEEFVIGRSGDLKLGDARVSRRHARIVRQQGSYVLEDLGSANGTFLDEEKVTAPARLQSGSTIRIGPFEMRFVIEPLPAVHGAATPSPVLLPSLAPASPPAELDGDATPPSGVSVPPVGASAVEAEAAAEPAPAEPAPPAPAVPPVAAPAVGVALALPPRPPAVSPLDLTDNPAALRLKRRATVSIALDTESLTLPVDDTLPLTHTLLVGTHRLAAEGATVVRRPDGYRVELAPGSAPISVNGQMVTGSTLLHSGDVMQLGPLRLTFLVDG
jgi:serine/threonine protein kinase